MRLEKGWRVEDVAKHAKCSIKTVNNVERGVRVYVATLKRFADAFGVQVQSLVVGGKIDDPPAQAPGIHMLIDIKLMISMDQLDETEQLTGLIQALHKLIAAKGEIGVASITTGSVIITLDVTWEDAEKLLKAIAFEGKGKELGIDCILQTPWRNYIVPEVKQEEAKKGSLSAAKPVPESRSDK